MKLRISTAQRRDIKMNRVIWTATAERKLTEVWLSAADRGLVADAANSMDRLLQLNPEQLGESRESGRRILLINPLAVKFRVYPEDRVVRVLYAWRYDRPMQHAGPRDE